MRLRIGGIFNSFARNLLLSLFVGERTLKICQYVFRKVRGKNRVVPFFSGHSACRPIVPAQTAKHRAKFV